MLPRRTSLALDDALKKLRGKERIINDVVSQGGEIMLAVKSAKRRRVACAMTYEKEVNFG